MEMWLGDILFQGWKSEICETGFEWYIGATNFSNEDNMDEHISVKGNCMRSYNLEEVNFSYQYKFKRSLKFGLSQY